MSLRSLVVSSDEKIVRVLRRVLSDLEIAIKHCETTDSAVRCLTRQRFEAVIVDCSDAESAAEVLRSVRSAPVNKRAVAVAIVDGQSGLRRAFELGAHFVLYKPISMERAKTSFRAARSLMKRERRRNARLAAQVPVIFGRGQRAMTIDLSEGGMAVQVSRRTLPQQALRVNFTLPGSEIALSVDAEVAWENATGQTGFRFVTLPMEARQQLKAWLNSNLPEAEKEDPAIRCRLTDLSVGGCYLESNMPFPVKTRVLLSMRVTQLTVQAEGVVRVTHPEIGMGIQFTQTTAQQQKEVEKFIEALMNSRGVLPDIMVEPDGLETDAEPSSASSAEPNSSIEDPLLDLFRKRPGLPADAFLGELRKQRRTASSDSAETILEV
jgi:DNA-binding response OmpR family regulator